MKILLYIGKRLLFLIPQLMGISFVTFYLIRLLPGDPAYRLVGLMATKEAVEGMREHMGLNQPIYVQYLTYVKNLLQGDFGTSWFTSHPVLTDLLDRLPATLELITLSLLLSVVIAVPLGMYTANRKGGAADRMTFFYGMLSGALPDFWLGLILVFIFFVLLGALPAPIGRLDIDVASPSRVTGLYLVDSLVTLNWEAFRSSLLHLILPVATLVFVYAGPILKMTRSTMLQMMDSTFVNHARSCGLRESLVTRYALRNALPPVVTLIGVIYGYLLGGTVLVETVFSWGGLGQYAVQSIVNSDFAPIQGFVLVAAVFSLFIYLVVDLIYFAIDPRIQF